MEKKRIKTESLSLYRVSQKSRTTQVFHHDISSHFLHVRHLISYTCAVKKFIDQLSQTGIIIKQNLNLKSTNLILR